MATQILLTAPEAEALEKLLDRAIGELKIEIRRTMTADYKDRLREEERVLMGLHMRLTTLAA